MFLKQTLAVAAMIMTPTVAFAEPGPMHGACMSDVKSLCGSVQPGGGRIRDCMKEHRAQLSGSCKIALADRMLERQSKKSSAAPVAAAKPAFSGED
jgi:hypothetical protein